MMQNSIKKCEEKIKKYFNKKYCFLVGRATTALYLILKSIKIKRGKVIVPSITCMNPVNAILYAGFEPLFCDINLKDFTLSTTHLKKILKMHKDIKAVILVHLYGNPCNFDKIKEIVRKRKILIIEDVAQALGGKYKGTKLGSLGDASILSFAENKMIRSKGGGAILLDNDKIARQIIKLISTLKEEPKNLQFMQNLFRRLYYSIQDLNKIGINTNKLFAKFPEFFKKMYLFKITEDKAKAIYKRLDDISLEIKNRIEKANVYKKRLRHKLLIHSNIYNKNQSAYWRYSLIYKGRDLEQFNEMIRKENIDVSNWYPALHKIFGKNERLRNAEFFEKHIINLWTDSTKTKQQIKKDCQKILNILISLEDKK